jgi:ATP-dependent RNA circularization protein (DNA/RNA ligase family)
MGIFEEYGIESVPSLQHAFKVFKKFSTIEEILAYADGPSINAKYREGIVFKPFVNSSKDSFKVISNKWLLKMET